MPAEPRPQAPTLRAAPSVGSGALRGLRPAGLVAPQEEARRFYSLI